MPKTPAPDPYARLRHAALWAFAAHALARFVAWFGSAKGIAEEVRVNPRWVWDIMPKLSALSALVRRLVIAEARALAAQPEPPTRAVMGARAHGVRRAAVRTTPPWRGRLCIVLWPRGSGAPPMPPPAPRKAAIVAQPMLSAPKTIDVLPFARRVDAIARAVADPAAHAARLARRMRRANAPMKAVPRPVTHRRLLDREGWRDRLRDAHRAAQGAATGAPAPDSS